MQADDWLCEMGLRKSVDGLLDRRLCCKVVIDVAAAMWRLLGNINIEA